MNISFQEGIISSDGSRYSGFVDNVTGAFHGYGVCEFADGGRYEGSWAYGRKQGWGIWTFAADDVLGQVEYVGGMWEDELHGYGRMTYNDGTMYDGGWCRGLRSGWGHYTEVDYGQYIGGWSNDQANGYALRIRANGSRYEGGYKDAKREGYGSQAWADGSTYEGAWKNDTMEIGV